MRPSSSRPRTRCCPRAVEAPADLEGHDGRPPDGEAVRLDLRLVLRVVVVYGSRESRLPTSSQSGATTSSRSAFTTSSPAPQRTVSRAPSYAAEIRSTPGPASRRSRPGPPFRKSAPAEREPVAPREASASSARGVPTSRSLRFVPRWSARAAAPTIRSSGEHERREYASWLRRARAPVARGRLGSVREQAEPGDSRRRRHLVRRRGRGRAERAFRGEAGRRRARSAHERERGRVSSQLPFLLLGGCRRQRRRLPTPLSSSPTSRCGTRRTRSGSTASCACGVRRPRAFARYFDPEVFLLTVPGTRRRRVDRPARAAPRRPRREARDRGAARRDAGRRLRARAVGGRRRARLAGDVSRR